MTHLSYSQVDTLLSCGEKYRITRIEGIQEDPAWWLFGGSAVHAATEWHDLGDDRTAEELFAQAMREQLEEAPVGAPIRASGRPSKEWTGGEDDAWWAHHGPNFVQNWMDWRKQNPNLILAPLPADVPAVEVQVGAVTPDGVALKGFIDRVFADQDTGDLLIVDLKTGKNNPGSSLQMDFYRYALTSTLNITAHYGAFWMARKGTFDAVHSLWRTDEQIEDMLRKARILIDNELFIPHLSFLCSSCGVKEHCSAYTNLNRNQSNTTER